MNEMYDMSIITHSYGVFGILVVLLVNYMMLQSAKDLKKYKRLMRIFTPISSIAIGVIIFTGVIMMAAKHLSFSIENIIMIIFALFVILLEVKRAKTLKYLNPKLEDALKNFKPLATKIFLIELALVVSISVWMWMQH